MVVKRTMTRWAGLRCRNGETDVTKGGVLLGKLFESMPDAVFVIDGDGTILSANEAACRQVGRALDDMVDESLPDLLGIEACEGCRGRIGRTVRHRRVAGLRVRMDPRRGPTVGVVLGPLERHPGPRSSFRTFPNTSGSPRT